MEKVVIKGNRKSPSITLDPANGFFEIKGNSVPEDAGAFYKPVIQKLEEYFFSPFPLTVINIALDYYNSSTSKWLLTLFQVLKKHNEKGHEVFIKWYYEEGDEDSQSVAKDYSELLDIPIRFLKAS